MSRPSNESKAYALPNIAMTVISLPNELIEAIIAHLDNRVDHLSCASVSWSFYKAVFPKIYQALQICVYEKEPRYAELRCRRLNSIIRAKPYVLNCVQRLHVVFSAESPQVRPGSLSMREKWIEALVEQDGDGGEAEEDQTDSFVALLLRLAHSPRLQELTVEYKTSRYNRAEFMEKEDAAKRWLKDIIGPTAPLALCAIRCIPSIRRVHLINLYYPPLPLLIGIPGSDAVEYLTLQGVNYSLRPSMQLQARNYWIGTDIQSDGPLAALFRAVPLDWEEILRIWRKDLDSSAAAGAALPFHRLSYLSLTRGSRFAQDPEGVAGLMSGELLPALTTFHERTISLFPGYMAGLSFDHPQSPWLVRFSHLDRLIIDVAALTESFDDWIQPSTLGRLCQLRFVHRGNFSNTYTRPTKWLSEVASYLQLVERHHEIEEVAIHWSISHPWISDKGDGVYQAEEWNALAQAMDTIPALVATRMVLYWNLIFGPRAVQVDYEASTEGMRRIWWDHPRCFSRYVKQI